MKKWLSMFLAAVMLCGVLAGCGGTQSGSTPASGAQSASAAGDSNVNAEGFPIVNEPITLRGMVALNANVKDWNEHPALKRMEELTGIHIEWECVPDAGFTEKRNLAFASDDLPDIILRAKISPQEEMKYAANGQLVALDEYLDYAPNLSALIEQDDAIRKGITMPDGHIYSCPQLNKTEGNLIHHYWINKTWLDNLGLEAPTTVDELYDVLVAFRDNDPNGNGQKDEIPYCVVGKDYPHRMFYDLLGSWGFGINGVMDSDYAFSWLDIDDAGNVRFIGREDKFKNMVEFYNKLWTEGLVDKPARAYKLRVEMGWGNSEELTRWAGRITTDGRLAGANLYLRGRSLLSPTNHDGSPVEVNEIDNRVLEQDTQAFAWQCETVRNKSTLHPQTDAVVAEIEGGPDTVVNVTVNGRTHTASIAQLLDGGVTWHVKPWHSEAVKIHAAVPDSAYEMVLEAEDEGSGGMDVYHAEFAQKNGQWAFVSPIYAGL